MRRRPGTCGVPTPNAPAPQPPCTCLPLPSACAGKQSEGSAIGPASLQTAGRRGDGVSHSHALDQRSGFMGGARRGLNGALCVTAGTSSNLRLWRVMAGGWQSSAWSKHLRLRPLLSLPSLISLLFLLFFFFFFFTTRLFASYQVGTSDQVWVLDKLMCCCEGLVG